MLTRRAWGVVGGRCLGWRLRSSAPSDASKTTVWRIPTREERAKAIGRTASPRSPFEAQAVPRSPKELGGLPGTVFVDPNGRVNLLLPTQKDRYFRLVPKGKHEPRALDLSKNRINESLSDIKALVDRGHAQQVERSYKNTPPKNHSDRLIRLLGGLLGDS